MLSFFPRDVLNKIWDLIGSVSESFPIYFKNALTSLNMLAYPIPYTAVFYSQEQDGREKVIAYMSKAINKHEQLYCATRKELLAVMYALRTFHSYLYGQPVLLRADNSAVSWLRQLKNPTM